MPPLEVTPEFTGEYLKTMAGYDPPAPRLRRLSVLLGDLTRASATVLPRFGLWGPGPAATFDPAAAAWWPEPAARAGIDLPPPERAAAVPAVTSAAGLLAADTSTIASAIAAGHVSARQLAEACLEAIAAANPGLNALVAVTADRMLAGADALDAARARGEQLPPLAGVPLGAKDLIATAGTVTAGGSAILAGHTPEGDARVLSLLLEAGALLAGKTNTHEFAFGATTNNPHYGPTRNPWDLDRVPGGSSGGSAAAVAAGLMPVALGTDTGGSVRIPAALTGTVGLKPTYGLVSRAGIMPLSWSLDHPGPITRHALDAARLLEVMAGFDPADPATRRRDLPRFSRLALAGLAGLRGVRIGLVEEWMSRRVMPGVRQAVLAAVDLLVDAGASVEPVRLPPLSDMVLVNRLLALPEAATVHAPYLQEQADRYGDDVRTRLELGLLISAREYIEAQQYRGQLVQLVAKTMQSVDLLALPSTPITAPLIGQETVRWGEGDEEPVGDALIRLLAPFNVTGQPAISIPCGRVEGLPVGLQLVGRPLEDGTCLAAAVALQAAADWTLTPPPAAGG